MAYISNLNDYTITLRKQVNNNPRQSMLGLKNIVSTFKPYTCQNAFQRIDISNQPRKTEPVADKLIGSPKIGRSTHIQVYLTRFKPLKPTQPILSQQPPIPRALVM
jgi:hypothetical protein